MRRIIHMLDDLLDAIVTRMVGVVLSMVKVVVCLISKKEARSVIDNF